MGNQVTTAQDDSEEKAHGTKSSEEEAIKKETMAILDNIPGMSKGKAAENLSLDLKESPNEGETSDKHFDNLHKLAKAMASRSHKLKKCEGICSEIFKVVVSPKCDTLGMFLFNYFLRHAKRRKDGGLTLSKDSFECEARKLFDLIRDNLQLEYYVKVFSTDEQMVSQESFRKFLRSSFQFWLPEGRSSLAFSAETNKTIEAITKSAYHGKLELSVKYVTHWLEENLPRVVVWMHKNVVHQLTVGHRFVSESPTPSEEEKPGVSDKPELERSQSCERIAPVKKEFQTSIGLKLQRMMSEKSFLEKRPYISIEELKSEIKPEAPPPNAFVGALHLSQVWLLSCVLPDVYNRAPEGGTPSGFSILDPQTVISKLLNPDIPSHWTTIYDSDQNGLSLNRFQHHIFGYRGHTVILVRGDSDQLFVVAIDTEWKESTKFWGNNNCIALQLSPEFRVLERGPKMIYFNVSTRGYPFGLQVGTDYKNPVLEIDKDFTRLSSRKIPYKLEFIHVWGCSSQETRQAQLVHKKWELTQVERAKRVNLNACEWDEHPDKYLLELGRSSYNQPGNV